MSICMILSINKHLLKCVSQTWKPLAFSTTTSRPTGNLNLPEDIEFQELKSKLDHKKIFLIDVRNKSEAREHGYIPGSVIIPLPFLGNVILLNPDEFEEKFGFPKPAFDDPLATMCLLGVRAKTAQLALKGAGYTNVRLYLGSFKDWVEKEGQVMTTS